MTVPTSFHDLNTPPGERAASGLTKIATALRHQAWSQAPANRLTPTQASVLTLLQREAPLSLSQTARQLAIGRPTVSEVVSTLVDKGLVRKHSDPADARRRLLDLTAAGRRLAQQVALWPDFLAEVVDELDADEQAALLRTLQKVIRRLQLRGEVPLARMCSSCTYFRPWAHPGRSQPHHCAYVDLPFGDRDLRFDCDDHEPVAGDEAQELWRRFATTA